VKRFCQCGEDISYYKESATICFSCRRKNSPVKTCCDCGAEFQELNAHRCNACRRARYAYTTYGSGQVHAISEVAKARREGVLPPPTDFQCEDCGAPATEYDHRDYGKPLDVAPVCRGCNRRRGSAKGRDWSFDEFWAWFSQMQKKWPRNFILQEMTRDDFGPYLKKFSK
jgi:hypothetical protein